MNSIVQDVISAWEYEINAQKELRKDSEDNYNYMRGDQWTRAKDAKSRLEKEGKPALNLNLILPVITLILGYNVQNRYGLKAYPGDFYTTDYMASLITRLLKHTEIISQQPYEMSQTVLDALVANIGGYLSIDWTNESNPMGDFIVKRESPFYHLRDSNNERYDINYGEYHIRSKWLSKEALKASYPEHSEIIERYTNNAKDKRYMDFFVQMWQKITKSKTPSNFDYINTRDGLYRVVELWEFNIKQEEVLYNLGSDDIIRFNTKQLPRIKELIKNNRQFEITSIKHKELRVKTTLGNFEPLVNNELYDVQIGKFPFVNMNAFWIDGQGMSNVENLKDFQDEHNKRSSQILHIINGIGNSGWWVKELGDGKAQVDIEDLIANGTKVGWVGKYKGSNPPVKIEPNRLPSGHIYLDEKSIQGMRNASGIGESIRGQQESSGESGRLFQSKVRQNEIMLEHFFDNVRQSKLILGNYLVNAYPKKYNQPERVFRIVVDDDNVDLLTINSNAIDDITKGKFKVTLDQVDHSPTARQQEFIELMGLASAMPQELVNWPELLRASNFVNKEKLAAYAEKIMGMSVQPGMSGVNVPQPAQQAIMDEQKINSPQEQ